MIRFLQSEGKTKKYVLGGLLLLICISMVAYLTNGIGSSGGALGDTAQGVVATVDGEKITSQEVREQSRAMLRQQVPRGEVPEQYLVFFNGKALDQLIDQKALLVAAQNMGLRASDAELREDLEHGQSSAMFFPGGKFIGEKQYEELLQQYNLTPAKFEQGQKESLLLRKLQSMVVGAAAVSNADVDVEARKRNTKVKFDYAIVDAAEVKKGIHPSQEELKAFYESNKATYANSVPEKRKLRYVLLDVAKFQSTATVSNQDLQGYYDGHKEQYKVPERAMVRHIVIKAPPAGPDGKVDPKALEVAQAKANEALKQLRAGADFTKVAQEYSDDPSKDTGGLLGWLQRGSYPAPDVEKTIFNMSKGQLSDVMKSSYGFHIVRVEDKQEAHYKLLEEVKPDIEPLLKQQAAQRQARVQADAILNQSKAGNLESAAHGAAITTDFVSATDKLPGIGTDQQLMGTVFAAKPNSAPEAAATAQGYVVYEVLAVQPPGTPTFEDIRSKVEAQFKDQQSGLLLGKKTQELADRARNGHDLKKAAKELGLTVKTSEPVLATGQVPDIGSMSSEGVAGVFAGKPGDIVGPSQVGPNGAVLQVVGREEPSAQEMAQKKDEVRESLLQSKRGEMFNLYLMNLRKQMEKSGKIVVNETEKKQLTEGAGPAGF